MASWIRGSNPSTNRGVRANEQAEERHIRSSSGCNKDKEARPDGRRLDAFEKKQDSYAGSCHCDLVDPDGDLRRRAVPNILLAITIVAALGASNVNLIIALTVSSVPGFSRIVRGAVLTVRDAEYIEAARAIGAKTPTIILSHVLPNCMGPILVQTTLNVGSVILSTAGLSFLGLGVQPPRPEWGAMLSGGRTYIRDYSYITMFPGIMIMITILSLNLLGDGLRDALDPRLK